MRRKAVLHGSVLLIVAMLAACNILPGPRIPGPVNSPAGLSAPSLSNPARPTEENQSLTTLTPVEPTGQFLSDTTIQPGSIVYRTSTSTATPTTPTATVVPGKVERVNSGRFAGWYKYTHPKYGFSIYIPSNWTIVDESAHHVGVSPVWRPEVELNIGFKNISESGVVIMRTGIGAGDVVTRGTVHFLDRTLTRDVLVYQGKDKAVLYNNAMETQIDDLVFTLSMDDFRTDYDAAILPADIQHTADRIVESFELADLTPASTGEALTNDRQPTFPSAPSTSPIIPTPVEPSASPTAPRQTVFYYTTQSSDNLFSIAGRFGLHPETILWANASLQDNPLNVEKPGVEIRIPTVDGYFYVWRMGDTLQDVAKTHGASLEEIVNWPGNELDPANPEASLTSGKEIFLPGGYPEIQN
jgi:hypothetical protein